MFFFPWQTALKLLVGNDEVLLHVIPILLGRNKEYIGEGNFIEISAVREVVYLMKENSFSHLMEVSDLLIDKAYVHVTYILASIFFMMGWVWSFNSLLSIACVIKLLC
jgi:hypothetical protein